MLARPIFLAVVNDRKRQMLYRAPGWAVRLLGYCLAVSAVAQPTDQLVDEIIVTASQIEETAFQTSYSVDVISANRIRSADFRSTPDIFREVPGALVQKTAYGQGSPYIRGFTGFRNLFMIDSIRLNNAVFRDGPNQYWATVDTGSIERMEIVRGPKSVLYGSDAVGGTVNVITHRPTAYTEDRDITGSLNYRYATGENSNIGRASLDLALAENVGVLLNASVKDFGDLESGGGKQPNTGYDEWTLDMKLVADLSDRLTLTVAHSEVHQDDVPRTHKTIYSRSYKGTTIGSELRRDLDQDRRLTYLRLDADEWLGLQQWNLTVYRSQQDEKRERLRSGDRQDRQGFEVETWGFNLVSSLDTEHWGLFTGGLDWAHDKVDSYSSNNPTQGPVADDSSYDWVGVFVQNRYQLNPSLDLTTGLRLGYFEVDAGSVSDPVDGSAYSYQQDWTEPVGSLRLAWSPIVDQLRLYSGISQGFRAPNLSDLTRFDSARSNEFEVPSVDLDPERYTSYELGARFRQHGVAVEGAIYYTDIKEQIQRVLTGRQNADGENEVTKANIGNGEIYGLEMKLTWQLARHWSAFGHYAWLDGQISSVVQVGSPQIEDNHDRMMPTNYRAGLRYQPDSRHNWWLESEVVRVEKADQLSLRDMSDTDRIPVGGTPAYTVWHIRGGVDLTQRVYLNLAVENLLNENYRVHGSGQNEAGSNFVVSIDYSY